MSEAVRNADRWYYEYVSSLGRDALDEQIEFAFVDGDLGRMSREEMQDTAGGFYLGPDDPARTHQTSNKAV
jgi:hypothetical protein